MDLSEAPPRKIAARLSGRLGFWPMAILSVGVAGYGFAYLGPAQPPPPIALNTAGMTTLIVHASCAAIALLIGPWQFLAQIRIRRRRLHRWLGRLYCLACLVGGVSGAALAFGSSSGLVARAGFGFLAGAWLACTALAWASAVTADFAAHRMWMIRSFALTFAAVTLRLYLGGSGVLGLPFGEAYPVISWLCWVPNLIVAEVLIRRQAKLPIAMPANARTPET
jgi:hypothetical protein